MTPSRTAVVDRLREDIQHGRFHPREHLVEADLATYYGVSRSAVRAAILLLSTEGLVERQPNRGARVRSVSLEEAAEIFEVRLVLMAMSASKAAVRGTDEERAELLAHLAELEGVVQRGEIAALGPANARLAADIRAMGRHSAADRLIEQLWNQNVTYLLPMLPERREESLREWSRIVHAVADGDADEAYAATIDHMHKVLAALRAIRDGQPVAGAIVGP